MNHGADSNINPNAHPFSANPPLSHTIVLLHAACMLIAFGFCYPFAIVHAVRKNTRIHILLVFTGTVFAVLGFLLGYGIDLSASTAASPDNVPASDMGDNMSADHTGHLLRRQPSLSTSPESYGLHLSSSAHAQFSTVMLLLLIVQVTCGVYNRFGEMLAGSSSARESVGFLGSLPLRAPQKWWKKVPPVVHAWLGKSFLLLAYVQIVLGMVVVVESCPSEFFAQCVAHILMGSSFLWYGTLSLLHLFQILVIPAGFVLEYYESLLITIWGIINTFALHRWGTPWSHQDLQHASLGVLWWSGGILSLTFSWQRWFPALREHNIIPAVIIALTGLAMSSHSQHNGFAVDIHKMFGATLMGGAAARIIQVIFRAPASLPSQGDRVVSATDDDYDELEEDADSLDTLRNPHNRRHSTTSVHQHQNPQSPFAVLSTISGFLAAVLVLCAGIIFMAANQEWLNIVSYYVPDTSTYINALMGLTFCWILYVFVLASVLRSKSSSSSSSKAEYAKAHLSDGDDLPLHDILATYHPTSQSEAPLVLPSEYRAKRRSLLSSPTIATATIPDSTRPLINDARGNRFSGASSTASGSSRGGGAEWAQWHGHQRGGSQASTTAVFAAEPGILEDEGGESEVVFELWEGSREVV